MKWRGAARLLGESRAQATVEMAVVTPVLIVLALIVYNVMLFSSAVARFDRVAPDIVLAQAVSPVGSEGADAGSVAAGEVASQLEDAMAGYDVEIEVSCESASGGDGTSLLSMVGSLHTYRCVMRMRPWPTGVSIAGVSLGAPAFLTHERPVTIDPWRPGVIV